METATSMTGDAVKSSAGPHRFCKVRVKLQHVVELLLQRRRPQGFVLVVLQKVSLRRDVPRVRGGPLQRRKKHIRAPRTPPSEMTNNTSFRLHPDSPV